MKIHDNPLLKRSTMMAFAAFIMTAMQFATMPAYAQNGNWPDAIPIPVGFEAEGIALGKGQDFFVGGFSYSSFFSPLFGIDPPHPISSFAGAIYKGNLRTGEGMILVPPTGKPLSGLSYDPRTDYLYAATGNSDGFFGPFFDQGVVVYNASSGDLIAEIIFGDDIVINDVLVTRSGVYCTDSINPILFKVSLDSDGKLPSPYVVEAIEMPNFGMVNNAFNANGLAGSFEGDKLLVINTSTGVLYLVDTATGAADPVNIQGDEQVFANGDGLVLQGRTLYILQNFLDKIAVVQLSGDLTHGSFVKNIPGGNEVNPLNVATTLINFGNHLYAINSHIIEVMFGIPAQVQSEVVKLKK